MHCYLRYWYILVSKIGSEIQIFNFVYLSSGYYLREHECEDPWLFFEAKRGPRAKTFGEARA